MDITFPRVIDSSIRKEFDMCPQRCMFSYFRGIAPVGGNIHLHFGGCFAKGLEHVRLAFYGENLSVLDSLSRGYKAIIKSWGDYEAPDNSKKNLASCLIALQEYFIQYPPDTDALKPLIIDGKPTVEFTFAIPIPDTKHPETGEPILYGGRFDMLCSYHNAVFIEDDKTASQLGASWSKQFKLASQLTGYVWAGKQYGYPIQGAIVRGVSILQKTIGHQMVIESRPEWMIDRWLIQLKRDIDKMIVCWKEGFWDRSLDHACASYGGCQFLTLCLSPDEESWIKTHYEVKKWDPLAKDEEGKVV